MANDDAMKVACEYYGVPLNGDSVKGESVQDLAALITRERRQARIETLEHVKSKCALGLDSIIIFNMVDAELARLKGDDAPKS